MLYPWEAVTVVCFCLSVSNHKILHFGIQHLEIISGEETSPLVLTPAALVTNDYMSCLKKKEQH